MRTTVSGKRFALVAPLLMVAGLGVAACGSGTSGSPQPAPTSSRPSDPTSTAGQSGGGGSGSAPTAGSGKLTAIDPCNLITTEEGAQWGITGAKAETGNGARSCTYNQSNNGVIGVDIRDSGHQGLNNYHNKYAVKPIIDTTVGTFPAKEHKDTFGGYDVILGILHDSTVDIQASENANEAEAKKIATAVAKLVAGKITGN